MRRLAILIVALACGPAARAQQRSDTLVLTLDQALEIASRNNPAYLRAVNELALNGPATRAAWVSGILPSVRLDLFNTGYTGNLQRRATDNFGNPITNPDAEYVYFSNTRQGLGLSWQLRGASPWNRLRQMGAENDGRELGEELARETLHLEVQRRFFAALEQDELLAAERAIAEATRSDLEAAQRLFELALKSRVDVLQAELQIEQQALLVRRQEGLREQARLALATVLGEGGSPRVRAAPTEIPLFDPADLDEEALVERTLSASPLVRRADAALRVSELALDDSRASYWPLLYANFDVGRTAQAPSTNSLFDLGGFRDDLYSYFSVGLSFPFFNNALGNQLMVSSARVARENADDDVREARLEAERLIRSAVVTLRDAWDGLRIAERALAIASEALELAREEYRLGTRTFEALQQSVRSEADARRQLIQARYGFVDALLDLEEAVGGPVR
jgi:outer membrane protein